MCCPRAAPPLPSLDPCPWTRTSRVLNACWISFAFFGVGGEGRRKDGKGRKRAVRGSAVFGSVDLLVVMITDIGPWPLFAGGPQNGYVHGRARLCFGTPLTLYLNIKAAACARLLVRRRSVLRALLDCCKGGQRQGKIWLMRALVLDPRRCLRAAGNENAVIPYLSARQP